MSYEPIGACAASAGAWSPVHLDDDGAEDRPPAPGRRARGAGPDEASRSGARPDGDEVPEVAHERHRPTELNLARIRGIASQAYCAIDRMDVDGACLEIGKIWPRSEVPHALLRTLCRVAVMCAAPEPVMRLIKDLAKPPGDLYRPSLGFSDNGTTLSFKRRDVFFPAPEGHINVFEEGSGLTRDEARILFELHWRLGRITLDTAFVVGQHGAGTLREAVAGCIRARGWTPATPLWRAAAGGQKGLLVSRLANDLRAAGPPPSLLPRNRDGLEKLRDQLAHWGTAEQPDNPPGTRLDRLIRLGSSYTVAEILEVFQQCSATPLALYAELAIRAVYAGMAKGRRPVRDLGRDLDLVLNAITDRFGEFPIAEWQRLITVFGYSYQQPWEHALRLFEKMVERGVSVTVQSLTALCAVAVHQEHLGRLQSLVDRQPDAIRQDMGLRLAMIRVAAISKDSPKFQFLWGQIQGRPEARSPFMRQSCMILACRTGRLAQAQEHWKALRQADVPMDRACLKAMVDALWVAGRKSDAGELMRRSVDHGDGVYLEGLGARKEPDGSIFMVISKHALLRNAEPGRTIQVARLANSEILAVLQLHWAGGMLLPGTRIHIHDRLIKDDRRGLLDLLSTFGLKLVPELDAHGVASMRWIAQALTDEAI